MSQVICLSKFNFLPTSQFFYPAKSPFSQILLLTLWNPPDSALTAWFLSVLPAPELFSTTGIYSLTSHTWAQTWPMSFHCCFYSLLLILVKRKRKEKERERRKKERKKKKRGGRKKERTGGTGTIYIPTTVRLATLSLQT